MTTWQIEPLGSWNQPVTEYRTSRYRFKASWENTLNLLVDEADRLDVRGAIALRIDVQRGDIRRDGMLSARASVGFPGVVVSFQSRFGPLSYATDAYEWWQHNVRAIALSLEALRAVDRYGVSKSGEQYAGWRAIEPTRPSGFATADDALWWLREITELTTDASVALLVRRASAMWHPDRNDGARANWDRLDAAKQVLEAGGLL